MTWVAVDRTALANAIQRGDEDAEVFVVHGPTGVKRARSVEFSGSARLVYRAGQRRRGQYHAWIETEGEVLTDPP